MAISLADIEHTCGSVGRRHLPCSPSRLPVLIGGVFCQYPDVLHLENYGPDVELAPEELLEALVWLLHHYLGQMHTVGKQSHLQGSVVTIHVSAHSDVVEVSAMLVFLADNVIVTELCRAVW